LAGFDRPVASGGLEAVLPCPPTNHEEQERICTAYENLERGPGQDTLVIAGRRPALSAFPYAYRRDREAGLRQTRRSR
jgi:hypothetical protein